MAWVDVDYPDLQPDNERTALAQRLDMYRAIAAGALAGIDWDDASSQLLPDALGGYEQAPVEVLHVPVAW